MLQNIEPRPEVEILRRLRLTAEAPLPRPCISRAMTIRGTVDKTTILLALVVVAGLWPWKLMAGRPAAAMSWLWIGLVGGLVTALIIIFKNDWAGRSRRSTRRARGWRSGRCPPSWSGGFPASCSRPSC
jgi:hypothetical protein